MLWLNLRTKGWVLGWLSAAYARDYGTSTRTLPPAPLPTAPDQGALPQPATAPLATQTASVTRPRRGRRMLVIGAGLTVAVAALLLAALWPGSPRHAGSDPRTNPTATSKVSPRGQPTPTDTATRSAAARTPQAQATGQVTSPASGPTVTTAPPVRPIESRCGASCVALYSLLYGKSEVLGVVGGKENIGQAVDLQPASASNKAEDWVVSFGGTVSDFYAAGLVPAGLDRHYRSNTAYEYEYAPFGVDSGLCIGVSGNAQSGTPLTLQPCGVSPKTVWVSDTADQYGQQVPLINATNTNFTQPLVLTANGAGVNATTSSLAETSGAIRNSQYWSTEH
jgi:hypothetical protein